MRIAILGAAVLLLSACDTIPGKVELDLGNGTVTAGTCTCGLPIKPPTTPQAVPPAATSNDQQPR